MSPSRNRSASDTNAKDNPSEEGVSVALDGIVSAIPAIAATLISKVEPKEALKLLKWSAIGIAQLTILELIEQARKKRREESHDH